MEVICANVIHKSAFVHGSAKLESPVHVGKNVELHANTILGKYTFINNDSIIYSNVKIGRYVSIGRNVEIGVAFHPLNFLSTHSFQYNAILFPNCEEYASLKKIKMKKWAHEPTLIGNDVWIGAKAIIMPGLTICDGAVIAAGAVVTKDIQPYEIWGGCQQNALKSAFRKSRFQHLLS